jgi:hypothetical protein
MQAGYRATFDPASEQQAAYRVQHVGDTILRDVVEDWSL